MHIDSYSFGSMTVDGTGYGHDLIVFPDRVMSGWWRTPFPGIPSKTNTGKRHPGR